MEEKICPVKGVGQKPCAKNCAWYTPFGCSVKVLADQVILDSAAKTGTPANKKLVVDTAPNPAGKTTTSKAKKPLSMDTKGKSDVH